MDMATTSTERMRRWRGQRAIVRTCLSCDEPFTVLNELNGQKFCSAICRNPVTRIRYENCAICKRCFTVSAKSNKKTCSADCSDRYRAARLRNREHIRRTSESDITPEQELAMRKRARKCPLCDVRLTSKLGQPNSKHLDHMLPLIMGGTHTHGNVRIICANCNLKRPKDGSDYTGPLTLWAQGVVPISRPHGNRVIAANRKTCRSGLHPWIPANIELHGGSKKRCKLCRIAAAEQRGAYRPPRQCNCGVLFPARGNQFLCPACTDAAARKAAELHAQGGRTWDQVAAEIGYRSGWGAAYAAKRIGYIPGPAVRTQAKAQSQRLCPACGTALGKHERCKACAVAKVHDKAWEAVALRQDGCTLRYIADRLGYDSITSVTNLMKTVIEIEPRMGRTPSMVIAAMGRPLTSANFQQR